MDETNPISQIDFMEAHIETLKNELAEKDAMIDWLANQLATNAMLILPVEYTSAFYDRAKIKEWRKAAQEAVKK